MLLKQEWKTHFPPQVFVTFLVFSAMEFTVPHVLSWSAILHVLFTSLFIMSSFVLTIACDTENDSNKTILKIEQPWNFYDTWTSRMDWLSSVIQDCISLSYNFRMKSHMTCWVHCCQRKILQVSLTNQWERHNTTVTFLDFVAGHVPGPEKEPAFQPLLLSIASSSSGTQTFPWVSSK